MSSINNRINSKAEQRLREKEFPLKIKKREKELLLEEAHSEVRKELNPSLKNIKVGISFSELGHIRAYNKAKNKEEKKKYRDALEEYWHKEKIIKDLGGIESILEVENNFRKYGTYGSIAKPSKAEVEATSKSEIKGLFFFILIAIVLIIILSL